uniref:RanBP2-type domain-containing protein n=1 Tax=Romanomermis culicivorax TaxID=13658 RepID=A0A915IQJ2_ROMCU
MMEHSRPVVKDGNWACPEPKCSKINTVSRSTCETCGRSKPRQKSKGSHEIGKEAAEKSKGLFSAEDWSCSKCGNINWSRRSTCNICNAPKHGEVEARTGYGGGYMDRQEIEYVKRANDDDEEYDEFGRKKKKDNNDDKEENDEEDEEEEDGSDLSKYKLDEDEDLSSPKKKRNGATTNSPVVKKRKRSASRSRSRSSSGSKSRSASNSSSSSRSRSPRVVAAAGRRVVARRRLFAVRRRRAAHRRLVRLVQKVRRQNVVNNAGPGPDRDRMIEKVVDTTRIPATAAAVNHAEPAKIIRDRDLEEEAAVKNKIVVASITCYVFQKDHSETCLCKPYHLFRFLSIN